MAESVLEKTIAFASRLTQCYGRCIPRLPELSRAGPARIARCLCAPKDITIPSAPTSPKLQVSPHFVPISVCKFYVCFWYDRRGGLLSLR